MTPKGGTPSMGAAHTPTPKDLVCPDCGSDEISRHSFEECCAILKQQRDTLAAERDAAESLVSAQHDALVAMKAERDAWEHRAEVAERENGEALAMLAFTGEPSSLWQAAAAARAKMDALTAHMNQVHETLGGSDTVLTLEAAQHVVAKLDAAERERDAEYAVRKHVIHALEGQGLPKVMPEHGHGVIQNAYRLYNEASQLRAKLTEAERERDRKESWLGEQADIISRGRAENARLRVKLAEAEKERGDADDALAACQAQAAGTIAQLREMLDKWEDSALNLLAVVHRDGGQHTATVGFAASCTEAEAVVVALRAKLADAEKDTARLDWLEDTKEFSIGAPFNAHPLWWVYVENDNHDGSGPTLRDAIDATMQRTAVTACERSSPIASGDTQGD
jgi:hypothetical protein